MAIDNGRFARLADRAAHHRHEAGRWLARAAQKEAAARELVGDLEHPEGAGPDVEAARATRIIVDNYRKMADFHRRMERRFWESIDQQKQLERAAVFDEVFAAAPSFLHVLAGPDFIFELANEAYYRLVGRRDLIGRPAFEALPELARGDYPAILARVLRTGEPFVGRELVLSLARAPGGLPEERVIDLTYLPLLGPDGTCTRVLGQGLDVTDAVLARGQGR